MVSPAMTVTFSPLSLPSLVAPAILLVLTWEWLRWGLRGRQGWRLGTRRAVWSLVLVGPLAALAGWILWQEPRWALAGLGVLAVAWVVRSYRQTTAPLPGALRRWLVLTRSLLVGLLVLLAAGPVVRTEQRQPVREGLAVLVDTSRSMARQDAPTDYALAQSPSPGEPALTRIESVLQALEHNSRLLQTLERRYDLRAGGFGTHVRYGPLEQMAAAENATAIGDAVQQAMEWLLADGVEPAGFLVLTDGCNNTSDRVEPLEQAEALASRGVALWLVGVGNEQASTSAALNVRRLTAPERIDAGDTLSAWAEIDAAGLADRTVIVTGRLGDEVIGRETITFTSDRQSRRVHFSTQPTRVGFHSLNVRVEPPDLEGRDLVGRLEHHQLVQVLSRQIRVLYIEGRRRHENTFITRALAGAQRYRVDRLILSAARPDALDAELADWAGYHVVILGDCPADRFTPRQIDRLREMVDRDGKGLLMLGGPDSFAGGGWAGTPLARALPIDLADGGELPGPVEVRPTPEAAAWGLMQLDDAPPDQSPAWQSLRTLAGGSLLGAPKPASAVLARSGRGEPLIVAQPYGAGRTMAIALDTTWQWVLTPDDTAELHARFWRQVVYYLADPTPNAWVVTDRTEYDHRRLAAGAEMIEVSAGVEDSAGLPDPDAPIELSLAGGEGEAIAVPLEQEGAIRRGRLPALAAGEYTLTLNATVEGQALFASHRFQVVLRDLEAQDVVANLPLLRQIGDSAAPGGGGYRPLRDLPAVLEYFATGRGMQYTRQVKVLDLAGEHRWPILLGLLGLIVCEWVVRKRSGLV